MKEVNVTVFQIGSSYFGVNQADSTLIATHRARGLLLLIIKSCIKNWGNNCIVNFYDKEDKLIESERIKIKLPKHLKDASEGKDRKSPKYLSKEKKKKTGYRKTST